MLALFAPPQLETILGAYDEVHPLKDGWRERVGLHHLHPLLVHAALFGSSYGEQALAAAHQYLQAQPPSRYAVGPLHPPGALGAAERYPWVNTLQSPRPPGHDSDATGQKLFHAWYRRISPTH